MTSDMLVLRVSSFSGDGQGHDEDRGEFIEHRLTEREDRMDCSRTNCAENKRYEYDIFLCFPRPKWWVCRRQLSLIFDNDTMDIAKVDRDNKTKICARRECEAKSIRERMAGKERMTEWIEWKEWKVVTTTEDSKERGVWETGEERRVKREEELKAVAGEEKNEMVTGGGGREGRCGGIELMKEMKKE